MPFKWNPFTNNLDEVRPSNSNDVLGPGSSTDDALVRWNGTSGTSIQNSNATLTDAGVLTLASPLEVSSGGSGVSSNIAYSILCAGITPTSPQQSLASVGTSGQILTSNGAGALPTFEDAAGGAGSGPQLLFTHSNVYFPLHPINLTTHNVTSLRLELMPFIQNKQVTLSSISIYVTASLAGSSARLGLYSQSKTTGNFTLVQDWGTVLTESAGFKTINVTNVLDVDTLYWMAFVLDENGGAVSVTGKGTLSPLTMYSSSGTAIQGIYLSGVGIGPLAASYNWTDFTTNPSTGAILFFQGAYS